MKLPWDKNYLKISFHVIFTLSVIYILTILVSNIVNIYNFAIYIVGKILSLLSPLIIGLVIAYLLDPLVDFIQLKYERLFNNSNNVGERRIIGASIAYFIIISVIVLMVFLIFNGINVSDFDLLDTITSSINGFNELLISLQIRLAEVGMLENLEAYIEQAISSLTTFVRTSSTNIINSLSKAGGTIANLFISIVIAFYCLMEKEKILKIWNRLLNTFLPKDINKKAHDVFEDINAIFSGYIRGELIDAFIVAVLFSVTLSLIGIKFPIIIGIISGISNLIPYFGAVIGFIFAVAVGLLSGEPSKALYAGIAIIILQQIDGIFIVPKVIGENVKLHPVVVLLSLSVAGSIFGIMGMVLAIPVVATIKLFLIRYYQRIERSKNR